MPVEWKSLGLFSEWVMDADWSEIFFKHFLSDGGIFFIILCIIQYIFVMVSVDKWYEKW